MKTMEQIKQDNRLRIVHEGEDGGHAYGALKATYRKEEMVIVFSWGGGWDHVSASFARRTPSWDEMCEVKDLFFTPEETCIQFHPSSDMYINNHPHCLHIWKNQGEAHELPPSWMVGIKYEKTYSPMVLALAKMIANYMPAL